MILFICWLNLAQKRKGWCEIGMWKSFLSVLIAVFVAVPHYAEAAALPYQAEVSAGSVTMTVGESKLITLKFKNIGTKTWTAGKSATAVYLYGKSTPFSHSSWIANDLPAIINEKTVKPGAMASASFYVTAPTSPGVYSDRFLLSYGPNQWIKDSVVTVTYTVTKTPPVTASAPAKTASPAEAVPSSSLYKATLVDKGGVEWQLQPGEQGTVDVTFKNTGTFTWKRTGTNYFSLYTWAPKYRASIFKDASWKSSSQAGTLVEAEVKPGQTGTIRFTIRGPQAEGNYQETFQLALEDKAWIDGGLVTIPVRVSGLGSAATQVAEAPKTTTGSIYSTILLLTSHKTVTLGGSDRLQLTHGFKNAGNVAWNSRMLKFVGVAPSLGAASNVHDASWSSQEEPVKATGVTAPGEIGFITYTIKAPAKQGNYTASFKLVADNQDVEGGLVEIPITVTSDGVIDPNPIPVPGPVVGSGPPPLSGDEASLPNEPIIRAGLYRTTDDTMKVRGVMTGYQALQKGAVICTFAQNDVATVKFNRTSLVYTLNGPNCTSQSTDYYIIQAADGISPLEITDYSRPIAWLAGSNDNKFRAKLELRFTPKTDSVWVINELLLESYLYGIAETSDVSPIEYQKALLTAARTYALYHVNRGTKHADEFFHVDSHLDQVYRGYGQEARSPKIVDGVKQTKGQIVTYDGKLAITPYFSRSDGRTRDWTDVWGGAGYAWLKAVPVPHDVGQTLWGHGVGLSARGALYMASKDGATYEQILKHFYTGIELRKAYK